MGANGNHTADECNNPPAMFLTAFFNSKSVNGALFRQQGSAVVLTAGGICYMAVPFAASGNSQLRTGHYVFITEKEDMSYHNLKEAIEFPLSSRHEFQAAHLSRGISV